MRTVNLVPKAYEPISEAIRSVWDGSTSASENWSERNPEAGQCAVVALLLQDYFGGELLRTVANGESHYYNSIRGEAVDLTRAQFEEPLELGEPAIRERSYVLSFPPTAARYELLRDRLAAHLAAFAD